MAIFGMGAFFDGDTDVSEDFLRQGVACIGWPENDAPAVHNLLTRVHAGDTLYIKAHPPGRDLTVKAVGIVTNNAIEDHDIGGGFAGRLFRGVRVRWIWQGNRIFHEEVNERYNVRNNTLYEEMSPSIQQGILALLLERLQS